MSYISNHKLEKPKWQAFLVGFLGYAYIGSALGFFLVLLCYWVSGLKHDTFQDPGFITELIVLDSILIFMVFRGLIFKLPQPVGIVLTPERTPLLFQLIGELRQVADVRVDRVVLTADFNAAVSQFPRLGFFGWYKNILTVGLPLLETLTATQCRGVLAHEFGHFSKAHGRVTFWIFHLKASLYRIVVQTSGWSWMAALLFRPFFNWYNPILDRYALSLSRQNEYEADRLAGAFAGPKGLATALIRLETGKHQLKDFLKDPVWGQMNPDRVGGISFLPELVDRLKEQLPSETRPQILRQALNRRSHEVNSHPALYERLRALGFHVGETSAEGVEALLAESGNMEPSGSTAYLGPALAEELLIELDKKISKDQKEHFERIAKERSARRLALEAVREGMLGNGNTLPELWYRATLLADNLAPKDETLEAFRKVMEMDPNHPKARYRLACLLLENNDPTGVALLEGLLDKQCFLASLAAKALGDYFDRQGYQARVETYIQKNAEFHKGLMTAQLHRKRLASSTRFIGHGLDDFSVGRIVAELEPLRDSLDKVYLIRREMKVMPDWKAYYLVVKSRTPWYRMSGGALTRKLLKRMMTEFCFHPHDGEIYYLVDDNLGFQRQAKRIKGSLILG